MATIESPDAYYLRGLKTEMESSFTEMHDCWRASGQPMGGGAFDSFMNIQQVTLKQYDYLILKTPISLNSLVITMNNIKHLSESIQGMFEAYRNHNICKDQIDAFNEHYNKLQEYVQGEIERFRSVSPNGNRGGGRRFRKIRRSNRKTRKTRKTKRHNR